MTKDDLKKSAVRTALAGGRKYGTEQHKLAVSHLIDHAIATPADTEAAKAALVDISNISALQQALDDAGLIDRQKKEKVKQGLWASLNADEEGGEA